MPAKLDIETINSQQPHSFLGVNFDSKPAALRQLLIVNEVLELYADRKGCLGLDIGSKYPDLNIIASHYGIKIVRLDITAREYNKDFLVADGQMMPFNDGTFDFVILSHVMAHVKNLNHFLREMSRALKPGGRAIILQSNRYGWWKFWGYYIRRNDRLYHYRTFDLWDIHRDLSDVSLNIKKIYSPYYFYIHSKLSETFYKLDRKLAGKIPNIFATQWIILAEKNVGFINTEANVQSPTLLIRTGVVIIAAIHAIFLKSLELFLRSILLLK